MLLVSDMLAAAVSMRFGPAASQAIKATDMVATSIELIIKRFIEVGFLKDKVRAPNNRHSDLGLHSVAHF
jgi:hypothetical protein